MPDFKVEKKIPIPMTASKNNYPFDSMDVGDSFSLTSEEAHGARIAASWYGKRNNKKFSVRRHNDTYRCWRTE